MTYFFEKPLEFFILLLYPWKFQTKQSFTSGNSTKLCYILWKLQAQKPRPKTKRPGEITHCFFLVTPGNSTSFLINPWKFHMLFRWYSWKLHILNPPCLVFFWNSPLICWPRKNSAQPVAQFLITFLFQGMMWMTYFSFFAKIGLMIPFLQSYTCLRTMLLTLWKDGQRDMESMVNREPSLSIKFSMY